MSDQSSNRPLTSKAVTYKALGGPEVIEYVERTVRAPAAGEVRVEVKAAAVNPADLMFRDPGWPNMTSNIVPGMDAAGVIESVGPGGCQRARGLSGMPPSWFRASRHIKRGNRILDSGTFLRTNDSQKA